MPYIGPIDDYCFEHLLDDIIGTIVSDNTFESSDVTRSWVSTYYPKDYADDWEALSDDDKFKVIEDLLKAAEEALAPRDY